MDMFALFLMFTFIFSAVIAGYTVIFIFFRMLWNNRVQVLKFNLIFWIFVVALIIIVSIINK